MSRRQVGVWLKLLNRRLTTVWTTLKTISLFEYNGPVFFQRGEDIEYQAALSGDTKEDA